MSEKSISVVVPCFNEGKTIYKNTKIIYQFLSQRFSSFEIIAVNDGSLDNTFSELEKAAREFPLVIINNQVNKGKGKAVRDGVLKSQMETVMFLDADLGIPIEQLDKFISEINRGNDLVIASRFVPGIKILAPVLWYRKIMEKVFRLLRMVIINNYAVQDTQCGFKVFTKKLAQDVFPFLTVSRFAFDAEMIYVAGLKGFKIKELPIILKNPTTSSVRLIQDSFNMLYDLGRIRWNGIRGKYK